MLGVAELGWGLLRGLIGYRLLLLWLHARATATRSNDCPRCHSSCSAAGRRAPLTNCDLTPEYEQTRPADEGCQRMATAAAQSACFSRLSAWFEFRFW